MTRLLFGFNIVPLDGGTTGLEVSFQTGEAGAGMEIVVEPIAVPVGTRFDGWNVQEGLDHLAGIFGVSAIGDIGSLNPPGPWGDLFGDVQILPRLRVQPVGKDPSIELDVQLFKTGQPHDSGIGIGGEIVPGISFEPDITVYDFVIGYGKARGLDLRARVLVHSNDDKTMLALGDPEPPGKPQLVSYPFPLPDQNQASSFKLVFLGLGQRFAPTIDLNAPDPLAAAFDDMEKVFTSDDPTTILTKLVQDYYKPEVGWFFALHLDVRGFTVRAVLADPVLYGLEITCTEGAFAGLLAEILYQKIGADLGVFYGKIVLPDNMRQIEVGAGSATLPSFQIWIYTNGDFKIAIGWPLGPDSFSLQVYIFTGSAALYFGKLSSGDNPTGRTEPSVDYNPILIFGLALKIGIGRSISKGPISAEASLTLQGVFQGLLAWKSAAKSGGSGINGQPDYYWFSASVTLAGVVQGSVDLGIISATVCIEVWATIATAFETKCNTLVSAQVGVSVRVSIKIVFVTIHISFSATLDLSFTLIDNGGPNAQIDGPSNPDLRAFIPNPQAKIASLQTLRRLDDPRLRAVRDDDMSPLQLSFILQPTVPYDASGAGQVGAVATLLIAAPDPANPQPGSDFEALADIVSAWLLSAYGGTWPSVATALGGGGSPPPADFETGLANLLGTLTFEITGVDLSKVKDGTVQVSAIFPMFDALSLTAAGKTANFGAEPLTYLTYPAALAAYFATLSALTPKDPPKLRAQALAGAPDGPSLSHLLLVNWFLALGRQIAAKMVDHEKQQGPQSGSVPTSADLASIAGMLSRMALHGTRLPDPAQVLGPGDPITEAIIHALYDLDNQQFTTADNVAVAGSLAVGATGGPKILFPGGATTAAQLPAAKAPPQPNPGWNASGSTGIVVTPLAPLSEGPLVLSVTTRTQGPASLFPGGTTAPDVQVLTLPATVAPLIAQPGVKGILRVGTDPTSAATACAPGLLIPLGLRRVPITVANDLKPAPGTGDPPTPVSHWASDVYELIGTDDANRGLLERALDDANFLVRRIVPLTFQAGTLAAGTIDPKQVVLFKSNLSTTSQPNVLMAQKMLLQRMAKEGDLGPVSASLDLEKDFLRLVWEASVVHAPGFYLRYADTAGNGLPDALFENDTARFWLWLDLGDAAATGTPIPPYASSLVIADPADSNAAKATQYLSLAQGTTPLTTWHPAFPPGCVGVRMDWNQPPVGDGVPYSAASVAALYQMIELQLGSGGGAYQPTLWSTPLSPVSQDSDGKGNITLARYKQVVPVWQYLAAPPPDGIASPYPAVAHPAALNFRLSDVYGNVLTDPTRGYGVDFPVAYNDPLLAPGSWPGCKAAYDIVDGGAGAPALKIVITFEPAASKSHATRLMATGDDGAYLAAEADAAMLATWTTIRQQAHDPNFGAAVSSTLYGDPDLNDVWPIVGDVADTLAQYRAAVETLYAAFTGGGTAPKSAAIVLPLVLARIAARPSDIFPLGVRLTLARSNVTAWVADNLPAVASIAVLMAPDLPPPAAPPPGPPPPATPSPLVTWARDVESLLAGFDGAGGQLKLAQRPLSAADDTGTGPGLWAVRFSATAGIKVTRQDQAVAPVFFTMQPFSLTLQYGQADITTWDDGLNPTTTKSSAASVDPDLLAQYFLTSFDRLMAPDLAAGIARIDPDSFATLMGYKATVASVLKDRLIPILTDQANLGDLGEAQAQFEQSLLAQLSNAYTTAAIAQVPLAVTAAGTAEAGAAMPPRLYGGLAAGSVAASPYSLTSPKLAIDPGVAPNPWLTFLVTVKTPEEQVVLDLDPIWKISHIEHDFETNEKTYGYLPSGWLKFVLPEEGVSPLNLDLGAVNVPVPLRRYPKVPTLISQVAARPPAVFAASADDDPIESAIRAAMKWPFTLTIGKSEQVAQDELWMTSTFNQPIDWQPTPADTAGPLTPLTIALLQFQAGFDSVAPLLGPQLEAGGALAPQLIKILTTLVGQVVAALVPKRMFAAAPPLEKLIWVLRYAKNKDASRTLFGRVDPVGAATPLLFPTISGTAPSGPPTKTPPDQAPDGNEWMQVTYAFPGTDVPDPLVLAIEGLDLLIDQTVVGSAYVTRNADLGTAVNPLLVYRTPEVSFSNVIVPYVEITEILTGPPSGPPMAQLLTSVLTPFADAGATVGQDRIVRISAAYNYPLVTPAGGDPLMATLPAVLNAGQPLGTNPATLAEAFADALKQWGQAIPLPRSNASFSISVSLFINIAKDGGPAQQLPLLTLDRIDLNIPPNWPSG